MKFKGYQKQLHVSKNIGTDCMTNKGSDPPSSHWHMISLNRNDPPGGGVEKNLNEYFEQSRSWCGCLVFSHLISLVCIECSPGITRVAQGYNIIIEIP